MHPAQSCALHESQGSIMAHTYVIAGATGMLGRRLALLLHERGDRVIVLTRSVAASKRALPFADEHIDMRSSNESEILRAVDASDGVINLSGANIGTVRWTQRNKDIFRSSRVDTTRMLSGALLKASAKERVFVSASAVGIYGHDCTTLKSEDAGVASDFLAELCVAWEAEAMKAQSVARVVMPRIGIVLDTKDGALSKMLLPFRFFVGGAIGSGRQWMSWIHLDDMIRALVFLLDTPEARGAVNCVAPNPVTMKEFASTLGSVLHRPSLFPVPELALKLLLGEQHVLVTASTRVSSKKLDSLGFRFTFSSLADALRDLLKKR